MNIFASESFGDNVNNIAVYAQENMRAIKNRAMEVAEGTVFNHKKTKI